jgi:hypothetical protein
MLSWGRLYRVPGADWSLLLVMIQVDLFPRMNRIVESTANYLIFLGETGRQPNPGTGKSIRGEEQKQIKIGEIVKACQVDHYQVLNALQIEKMVTAITFCLEQRMLMY